MANDQYEPCINCGLPLGKRTYTPRHACTHAKQIESLEQENAVLRKRVEELEHESGAYLRRADSVTGRCVEAEARAEKAERDRDLYAEDLAAIVRTMNRLDYPNDAEMPSDNEVILRLKAMSESWAQLKADLDAALKWIDGHTDGPSGPGNISQHVLALLEKRRENRG